MYATHLAEMPEVGCFHARDFRDDLNSIEDHEAFVGELIRLLNRMRQTAGNGMFCPLQGGLHEFQFFHRNGYESKCVCVRVPAPLSAVRSIGEFGAAIGGLGTDWILAHGESEAELDPPVPPSPP